MRFLRRANSVFIILFLIGAGAACSQAQEKRAGTYGSGRREPGIYPGQA